MSKKGKKREENLKKKRLENQSAWAENDKKVQQAQNWWSSLSQEEKLAELKKIEAEWIKKMGGDNFSGYMSRGNVIAGSSVEFKNGSLRVYPEDLSKIPPPLLAKFGVESSASLYKKLFPGDSLSDKEKISQLEKLLEIAKKNGNKAEINNLEKELQALKSQQKGNSSSEKLPNSESNKVKCWIMGVSLFSAFALGVILILKLKGRKRKIVK